MSKLNPQHRNEILTLRRKSGLFDNRNCTLMDRNLGASDSWIGRPVDEWLDSLTFEQGTQVLDKLRRLSA